MLEGEVVIQKRQERFSQLRALAARVKVEITTNPRFCISVLDVGPKEEGLAERPHSPWNHPVIERDIKEIEDIAKKVAGDVPIECEIQYRWFPRFGPWQFK